MAGGGNAQTTIPAYLETFHKEILDADGAQAIELNIAEEMWLASSGVGGNPFDTYEPYDPDPEISDINTAVSAAITQVDSLNPQVNIETFLDAAITKYNASLMPSSEITTLVNASEARSRTAFQRGVAGTMAFAWTVGAMTNSQLPIALRMAVKDRDQQLAEYEAKLTLFQQRDRTSTVIAIANAMANLLAEKTAKKAAMASLRFQEAQLIINAKQDEISAALEWETRAATWDMDLINDSLNVMSSIFGAAAMRRAPTKGERFSAAIGTGLNAGIQAGVAFGSPGAGLALGAASIGFQALPGLIDGL